MVRLMVVLLIVMLGILVGPATAQESSECPAPSGETPPTLVYEPASDEDLGQIFSTQIVDYLNNTGSMAGLAEAIGVLSNPEQPLVDAQVFEADITGEDVQNVLVNINVTWGAGYDNIIAVFGCAEGEFLILQVLENSNFFDWSAAPPTTIVDIVDMNNNGHPEIVQRWGWVGQKFEEGVDIYEWQDGDLVSVFSTGLSLGFFDSIDVIDVDGDNTTLELVLGDYWGYGQATAIAVIEIVRWRPVQITYAWDGASYSPICRIFTDEPTTRFETLHSAETLRACGDYEVAMVYYRALLDNEDLEGWTSWFALEPPEVEDEAAYVSELEYAYLRAFAFYRVVQLQLLAGDVEEAQATLEMARSEYNIGERGYQYVAMTAALVESFQETNNLGDACAAAAAAYQEVRESEDDPGLPYFITENRDGTTIQLPFYWDSGKIDSSDPDDIFNVPPSISDMVQIPICIR